MKRMLILFALVLVGQPAKADIVNGGFETGTFFGWSQINSGSGGISIDNGTFDPPGPGGPVAPYEGSFAAATFQSGGGQHTLYQDITLDSNLLDATLIWADKIENYAPQFSEPNQEWRVEVWNLANVPQAELFSTDPGDTLIQPWTERTADLSPWIGQTIRIAFTQQDSLSFFNARLDAVRTELTPIPAPAAALLATMGMGMLGGMRRRRYA